MRVHLPRRVCSRGVLLVTIVIASLLVLLVQYGFTQFELDSKYFIPTTSGVFNDSYRNFHRKDRILVTASPRPGSYSVPDSPVRTTGDIGVYVLSVIVSNTTHQRPYKTDLRLHGWIHSDDGNKLVKCCFSMSDGTVSEFYITTMVKNQRSTLVPTQFTCLSTEPIYKIRGVIVQSANSSCPAVDDRTYIKPYIPSQPKAEMSFAVCLKLVYRNVNNFLLTDWLEFYRVIGVDRIFMFTYNISASTESIIQRYANKGLVEYRPFDHPGVANHKVGSKSFGYFDDERVMLFDCLQRSEGYDFMVILDMDEFMVPTKHKNVKNLMKQLMKIYPLAAGFKLAPYIFSKDEKPYPSAPINGSDIVRYFKRTPDLAGIRGSRHKNILLPSRISADGLYTHHFRAVSLHHQKIQLNTTLVGLHHYRKCYSNLLKLCHNNLTTDTSILKFVKKFNRLS